MKCSVSPLVSACAAAVCFFSCESTLEDYVSACEKFDDALDLYSERCAGQRTSKGQCAAAGEDLESEELKEQTARLKCSTKALDAATDDCSPPNLDCDDPTIASDEEGDCTLFGGSDPAPCSLTTDIVAGEAAVGIGGELVVIVGVAGQVLLDPSNNSSFLSVDVENSNGPVASCTTEVHEGIPSQYCDDVGGVLGASDVPIAVEHGSTITVILPLAAAVPPFTVTATTGSQVVAGDAISTDTIVLYQVGQP